VHSDNYFDIISYNLGLLILVTVIFVFYFSGKRLKIGVMQDASL